MLRLARCDRGGWGGEGGWKRGAVVDGASYFVLPRGDTPQAFRRLDKDGSGVVTLSDLSSVYSTKFHPEVIAGKKTHEEAVAEYISQWDTKDKDGIITFPEFVEYYKVRCGQCGRGWGGGTFPVRLLSFRECAATVVDGLVPPLRARGCVWPAAAARHRT